MTKKMSSPTLRIIGESLHSLVVYHLKEAGDPDLMPIAAATLNEDIDDQSSPCLVGHNKQNIIIVIDDFVTVIPVSSLISIAHATIPHRL